MNRDTIGVRWLWWTPAEPVAYEHEFLKSKKSERLPTNRIPA
jgi:hypothetical protein